MNEWGDFIPHLLRTRQTSYGLDCNRHTVQDPSGRSHCISLPEMRGSSALSHLAHQLPPLKKKKKEKTVTRRKSISQSLTCESDSFKNWVLCNTQECTKASVFWLPVMMTHEAALTCNTGHAWNMIIIHRKIWSRGAHFLYKQPQCICEKRKVFCFMTIIQKHIW